MVTNRSKITMYRSTTHAEQAARTLFLWRSTWSFSSWSSNSSYTHSKFHGTRCPSDFRQSCLASCSIDVDVCGQAKAYWCLHFTPQLILAETPTSPWMKTIASTSSFVENLLRYKHCLDFDESSNHSLIVLTMTERSCFPSDRTSVTSVVSWLLPIPR